MDTEVREAQSDKLVLGPLRTQRSGRASRWLVLVGTITLLVAVGAFWHSGGASQPRYVSQPITVASLTVTVTATGNLEPRNQVEIGSELSGTVREVNVEVNDVVAQGDVLATLDTSRLEAQLVQTQSAVASAQAHARQTEAMLTERSANYARLQKLRELSSGKLPSQQDLDSAEAALARAQGENAAARAAVAQARASRDTIGADLSKAQIGSPISGLVLARSIGPGQTVAASLQAPVLFVLAEDLKQMELHVAVDEADVGALQLGQEASFTVDAYPDQVFPARITRIHMASNNNRSASAQPLIGTSSPSNAAGVVTYETVLEVDNRELLLRPGMTATAQIVTSTLQNVPLVPNVAMRFTPDHARFPRVADESERGRGVLALMPYLPDRWKCPRENGQALGCVWVLEDGQPELAIFKPGATDRTMTQVLPLERLPNWSSLARLRNDPVMKQAITRKLTAGMPVIVDVNSLEH